MSTEKINTGIIVILLLVAALKNKGIIGFKK
jgi:hypothetical protein